VTAPVLSDRRARIEASPLRHVDPLLIACPALLSGVGLVLIASATRRRLADAGLDPLTYVQRQGFAVALGLAVMAAVMAVDYRRLRELAFAGYLAVVALLAAVLSPLGVSVKGAQARFDLGPLQLQPGELAKFVLILVLAGYCAAHRGDLDGRRVAVALGLAAVPMVLIQAQPDLGTNLILGVITLAVLAAAGARARHLVVLALAGATLAVAAVQLGVLEEYQVERLTSFTQSGRDPQASGYNQRQSQIAIGNGGLRGQGLFSGTQTGSAYVPEQHTDFIFTVAGEELGFLGSAPILAVFALLAWRVWRAALLANDTFGTLCCVGVLAMLTFQVFQNVGMAMGIMPITGIPLPWLSYGGSSVLTSFACVGLVANVHMRRFA
jgi:rod shape determining protein RodA